MASPHLEFGSPESTLREAARIVRRARVQGKSFERIAAEMGVTAATARFWSKYRTPATERKKRNLRIKVSPRQQKLAQGLTEGKTTMQAAMDAGATTKRQAYNLINHAKQSPAFVEYFNVLLDKAGIDEETLAKGLKECLGATKVVGVAIDKASGTISDHLEHPDYQVRHQAIRTGFELRKRLAQRDQEANQAAAPVHLHLTIEQKQRYETLVGGPLAFDTIDVLPEQAPALPAPAESPPAPE